MEFQLKAPNEFANDCLEFPQFSNEIKNSGLLRVAWKMTFINLESGHISRQS